MVSVRAVPCPAHCHVVVAYPDTLVRERIIATLRQHFQGRMRIDVSEVSRLSDVRKALDEHQPELVVSAWRLDQGTIFEVLDSLGQAVRVPLLVVIGMPTRDLERAANVYARYLRLPAPIFADRPSVLPDQTISIAPSLPMPRPLRLARLFDHDAGVPSDIEKRELQEALRQGAIAAMAQPQYCLMSGEIVGVELLARWQLASGEMLSPDYFVPLISKLRMDLTLFETMLNSAALLHEKMRSHGRFRVQPLKFSINVSATAVRSASAAQALAHSVHVRGLDKHIVIEVTEDGGERCANALAGAVGHWRLCGFDCAIDDFGAGASSFRRWRLAPFNVLKIDRASLWGARAGMAGNAKRCANLRKVVLLAQAMRMQTVAEGIETSEDQELARAIGCDTGQGYLFSKPLSTDAFIALLNQSGRF